MTDHCSWDFATCELGVNMRSIYTPEEFEQRAEYLIDRFCSIGKPVCIISVFPNWNSPGVCLKAGIYTEHEQAYNTILADLVKKRTAENLHFIPGETVLTDFNGLSGDLIHPTAYGHAEMGFNLASILSETLKLD